MTDKNLDSESGHSQIPTIPEIIDCSPISEGISKEEIDDNRRISQDKQFQDSPEGIEMMREHYFDMINPERLQTSAPLEEEYKRDQIQKANDFLVADGFHLIERGNF